ncbi:hypothetical protein DA530_23255 [Salmonella enterica]|nr:hypothetical protein [Salmonella enterica]
MFLEYRRHAAVTQKPPGQGKPRHPKVKIKSGLTGRWLTLFTITLTQFIYLTCRQSLNRNPEGTPDLAFDESRLQRCG